MIKLDDKWLKCYKFYNRQNHPLAIYGKFKENSNILLVFILTLNSGNSKTPGELFSKKQADEYFEDYLSAREDDEVGDGNCKPIRFSMYANTEDFRNTFLAFCENNFWRKDTIDCLVSRNKVIKIDIYSNNTSERIDNKSLKIVNLSTKKQKEMEKMFQSIENSIEDYIDDNNLNINEN